MYRPLSLFIGLRYSRAKRQNHYISFVSLVSLLGMILGVVALIVVLSVMNGFEAELRGRILAVIPHGYLLGPEEKLQDWPQHSEAVNQREPVLGSAPYLNGNVMLSRPGMVKAAGLFAIDPVYENQVSDLSASIIDGRIESLAPGDFNIVLGSILARHMGLYVGDEVSVILPKVTVTPMGIFPRVKRFTVSGIFSVGAELDASTVFIHLADGQRLFQYGTAVKGLRVRVDDMLRAGPLLEQLLPDMPAQSTSVSWSTTQGSLFKAVKMEKTMISLLLLIIVAIAAFNIVSILTMMVADKRSDIAVLRTMGANPATIMQIFIIQGLSVGAVGIAVGLLIGIPVAQYAGDIVQWSEALLGGNLFDPNVYFISQIPSMVRLEDIVMVAVFGFVLSVLATLYPAYRASQVQPAEALSYD